MWPFRKRAVKVELIDDPQDGLFHIVMERKALPGPGVMNYAYETLALAPMTPIGPAVANRKAINPMTLRQTMVLQSTTVGGIPTQAGQIMRQPLYNPGVGYPSTLQGVNPLPYSRREVQPAGTVM